MVSIFKSNNFSHPNFNINTITYNQLKIQSESLVKELSSNTNTDTILKAFSLITNNLTIFSISYAMLYLNIDFINKIIQMYYDESYTKAINDLLSTLFEVFNFEMFSDSPTANILKQFKELEIEVKLLPIRVELTPIERIFDTMQSLLFSWRLIKDLAKEDASIEENNSKSLIERLDQCREMVNEIPKDTHQVIVEYFNQCLQMLEQFKIRKDIMKVEMYDYNKQGVDGYNNNQSQYMNNNINVNDVGMTKLHFRTFFILNEKIRTEENIDVEFKNYYYPIPNHLYDEIRRQICGFLNSQGGRLYIGVADNQVIKGIALDYKAKDLIRNQLVNCTQNFYPECRTNKLKVQFIPIIKANNNAYIKNLYVIKLIVKKGEVGKLYSVSQNDYCSFYRMQGQTVLLKASEIYENIIKRHTESLNININSIGMDVDEENLFEDPEPEMPIYYGDGPSLLQENVPNSKVISNYQKKKKNYDKYYTLKLDNIHKGCDEKELDAVLIKTGYANKKIFRKDGKLLGWAYLNYMTEEESNIAMSMLRNVVFHGQKLIVSFQSKP